MLAALSESITDNLELRRDAASARAAAEPSVLQLKQLLLEPSINSEFQRLRRELEAAKAEAQAAREQLEGATFSQVTRLGFRVRFGVSADCCRQFRRGTPNLCIPRGARRKPYRPRCHGCAVLLFAVPYQLLTLTQHRAPPFPLSGEQDWARTG